jgi:hypothetical protein
LDWDSHSFQGDLSPQWLVLCPIDDPHAASAKEAGDDTGTEAPARGSKRPQLGFVTRLHLGEEGGGEATLELRPSAGRRSQHCALLSRGFAHGDGHPHPALATVLDMGLDSPQRAVAELAIDEPLDKCSFRTSHVTKPLLEHIPLPTSVP